jgi:hypothetical protein
VQTRQRLCRRTTFLQVKGEILDFEVSRIGWGKCDRLDLRAYRAAGNRRRCCRITRRGARRLDPPGCHDRADALAETAPAREVGLHRAAVEIAELTRCPGAEALAKKQALSGGQSAPITTSLRAGHRGWWCSQV